MLNVQYWRDITAYINEVMLLEFIFCAVKLNKLLIIAKGKKFPKLMIVPNQCCPCTSSKRFKQQYNTNQNHGKHCLCLFCFLVSAILLFTLFKFENFEDRLPL